MKDGATYGEVSRLESFCTRMPHLHPPCARPGPAEGQEFPQGPSSDSAHHGCLCAPPWPANSLYPSLRARLLHLLHQTRLSPATSLLPNPTHTCSSRPTSSSKPAEATGHGCACLLSRPGAMPPCPNSPSPCLAMMVPALRPAQVRPPEAQVHSPVHGSQTRRTPPLLPSPSLSFSPPSSASPLPLTAELSHGGATICGHGGGGGVGSLLGKAPQA